jgi:mannitol-1-phosphate 5-dehydrogenase
MGKVGISSDSFTRSLKMRTAIQFGAGNIGRGFMGQLFWEGGYHTWFVEYNQQLVQSLLLEKSYPLKLLDAYSKSEIDMRIDNFEAVSTDNPDMVSSIFALADVAGSAVGVRSLESIAPLIAQGIVKRKALSDQPIDIYLCENIEGSGPLLKQYVYHLLDHDHQLWADKFIGFVSTSVARMVPAPNNRFAGEGKLFVVADSYHHLPYDEKARRAPLPSIEGLQAVSNFKAEVERKLYTHNLGHAAMGYIGYLKGYRYVHEPFEDPELFSIFKGALNETARALVQKYPEDIDAQEHDKILEDVNVRFGNPMLMDSLTRVARDPLRKLGPNDRLIGSAKLCLEFGIFPKHIATVCGAAYCYDFPEDPNAVKLQTIIREQGIEGALQTVSGIDEKSRLGREIINAYDELKRRKMLNK